MMRTTLILLSGVMLMPSTLFAIPCDIPDVLDDTDGDGLDDALECLLFTSEDLVDTDGDGLSDLEEVVRGYDPVLANTAVGPSTAALYTNVYMLEDQAVVQLLTMGQSSVSDIQMHWAMNGLTLKLVDQALNSGLHDTVVHSSSQAGYTIEVRRYVFDRDQFDNVKAIAFTGVVDSVKLASDVTLVVVDGMTMALRRFKSQPPGYRQHLTIVGEHNGQGGGFEGGLFPVEPLPDADVPPDMRDEVCFQILQPTGYQEGGTFLYEVVRASCEAMPSAMCFSSCPGTVGSIVEQFDPVGLLGG